MMVENNDAKKRFYRDLVNHIARPQALQSIQHAEEVVWPAVRPLLPRATSQTEIDIKELMLNYSLNFVLNELKNNPVKDPASVRSTRKAIQNLKQLLEKTQPHALAIARSVIQDRFIYDKPGKPSKNEVLFSESLDVLAAQNLDTLVELLDEYLSSIDRKLKNIPLKNRSGAPVNRQVDSFLIDAKKIWKAAGPECSNSKNAEKNSTEFIDFLMKIDGCLVAGLKLANSRNALIKRLERLPTT